MGEILSSHMDYINMGSISLLYVDTYNGFLLPLDTAQSMYGYWFPNFLLGVRNLVICDLDI